MTGTVFLLVVAIALAAAALTAWLGAAFTWQLVVVAVVTVVGSLWVMRTKKREATNTAVATPDVGRMVEVTDIAPDGSAEILYRGAPWRAVARSGALQPGRWAIAALDGPRLILEPVSLSEGASGGQSAEK